MIYSVLPHGYPTGTPNLATQISDSPFCLLLLNGLSYKCLRTWAQTTVIINTQNRNGDRNENSKEKLKPTVVGDQVSNGQIVTQVRTKWKSKGWVPCMQLPVSPCCLGLMDQDDTVLSPWAVLGSGYLTAVWGGGKSQPRQIWFPLRCKYEAFLITLGTGDSHRPSMLKTKCK